MSMFKSLTAALGIAEQPSAGSVRLHLNPEMAAAVLLLSMERADFEESPEERAIIKHLLARHFHLPEGELEALLEKAEHEVGRSVSFYDYVELLNTRLQPEEKCQVLKMLWEVAYADGKLDPFEEQLMRRLSDMLYMSHGDYVRTKLEVIEGG